MSKRAEHKIVKRMKEIREKLATRGAKLYGYDGFGDGIDVSVTFYDRHGRECEVGQNEWKFIEELLDELEVIK